MQILAIETSVDGVSDDQFGPLLKHEAKRVWELYQEGVLRQFYYRMGRNDAVFILECETVKDASDAIATLPFVRAGLIAFDFIPLAPFPVFAELFVE